MAKKYAALTDWLNDQTVRERFGINDTNSNVLVVLEMVGPYDIAERISTSVRPRPRARIGYQPGETVLWEATWEIPEEVDLTGYGMY